jgi:PQQ-dependent catabolism-associated CXXCW motif protein
VPSDNRLANVMTRLTPLPALMAAAFAFAVGMMCPGHGGAGSRNGAAHASESVVHEPEGYRTDDYRSPVPPTLKGAKVITAEGAEPLLRDKAAIFIDVFPRAPKPPNLPKNTVWRDPVHMSIEGGHWLPNVGYGVLSPEFEKYFRTSLTKLTDGDPARSIVFYCLRDCWMSWNAAKRAIAWGYTNVIWFSDGTDGWQEIGHDLARVEPVP